MSAVTSSPLALDARIEVTVGDRARAFTLKAELSLPAGVLVLFGPSGVGKTLTLQAIAGLLPGVRGHVRLGDEVLLDSARRIDVPAHRRRVGYVPQQHALFPFLDVEGNVGFGLPRAERRSDKVRALLDELGLARLAGARPGALSGGERQRVALGRALAVEPRLLLLDEPFASLDEGGREELYARLRAAIDRRGTPAVLVTHHAGEAAALGDRLVRFERGRTTEAGTPRALLAGRVDPTGQPRVSLAGVRRGPLEALGDGRARARLDDAVVEGPAELLRAAGNESEGEDEPFRLDLPR